MRVDTCQPIYEYTLNFQTGSCGGFCGMRARLSRRYNSIAMYFRLDQNTLIYEI